MSTLHLFYALTGSGALLFFLAGYAVHALAKAKRAIGQLADHGVSNQAGPSAIGWAGDERIRIEAESETARRQLLESTTLRARLESDVLQLRAEAAQVGSATRNLEEERQLRAEVEKFHLETRTQLDAATRELGVLRRQLAGARTSYVRCEQERDSARAAVSRLESEQTMFAARIAGLEEQSRAGEAAQPEASRVQQLKIERDSLRARERDLRAQQGKDADELAATKARLAEAAAEVEKAEARALAAQEAHAELARVKAQNEVELRNLRARVSASAGLADELCGLRAEHEKLCQEHCRLVELEGEIASAKAEQRGWQIKWQSAESKLAELERVRDELRTLREERAGDLDAVEAKVKLQAEVRDLRVRLQATENKVSEVERLHGENMALREDKRAAVETLAKLSAAQDEVRDLRGRLQTMHPKLAELERMTEENRSLREQVGELDGYREVALERERLAGECKRVRLDFELVSQRVKELEQERVELFDLRGKVQELSAIAVEVSELRRRESLLEAQLFSAGQQPQTHLARPAPSLSSDGTAVADIENTLSNLVKPQGVRSAVLADSQGFPIVTAGDALPQEGLAAFAGLAGEFAARARTLLPLGEIVRVCLHDANCMDASCRIFTSGGSEYGLATVGHAEGDAAETDALVAGLSQAIAAGKSDQRPS
jgi:chromosome segregation ATPase